jgi:hypothetical protein
MFKKNNINKNMLIVLLIIVVISIISFNFNSIVEGLTLTKISNNLEYTSCTQPNNCTDCLNANVIDQDADSPCYWNSLLNKCGSFSGNGYTRTCNGPSPNPNPICSKNTNKNLCIANNNCFWNTLYNYCENKLTPGPTPPGPTPPGPTPPGPTPPGPTPPGPTPPGPNCPEFSLLPSPVYLKTTN